MKKESIEGLLKDVEGIFKSSDNLVKKENDYIIFDVMRMQYNEVKTHSTFLSGLLNPRGRHGLGDLFLKKFIEYIKSVKEKVSFEENMEVFYETKADENGRLDIKII